MSILVLIGISFFNAISSRWQSTNQMTNMQLCQPDSPQPCSVRLELWLLWTFCQIWPISVGFCSRTKSSTWSYRPSRQSFLYTAKILNIIWDYTIAITWRFSMLRQSVLEISARYCLLKKLSFSNDEAILFIWLYLKRLALITMNTGTQPIGCYLYLIR